MKGEVGPAGLFDLHVIVFVNGLGSESGKDELRVAGGFEYAAANDVSGGAAQSESGDRRMRRFLEGGQSWPQPAFRRLEPAENRPQRGPRGRIARPTLRPAANGWKRRPGRPPQAESPPHNSPRSATKLMNSVTEQATHR